MILEKIMSETLNRRADPEELPVVTNPAKTQRPLRPIPKPTENIQETFIEGLAGLREEPWRKLAACLGVGPQLFFPASGKVTPEAQALCNRCPVFNNCRKHSLTDYGYGIHGTWAARSASSINVETGRYQSRPRRSNNNDK